ncbi:MAG: hypothetical protein B7Z68_08110 [Acidobacteria bacterium 21-70-11]|nr:MAG: hypothetical protein B7Z68_08110 [Acidobacteria bacterium 21-70-11]
MGMAFDRSGNLYVGNDAGYLTEATTYNVLKFSGAGAFVGVFVPDNDHGLQDPNSLVFGADGNLYIAWEDCTVNLTACCSGAVSRYNGTTGAFIDVFVAAGEGGLSDPKCLAFTQEKAIPLLGGWGMFLLITAVGLSAAYVLARRAA